jgi:hypothetical protein
MKNKINYLLFFTLCFFLPVGLAYDLFHPTPEDQLRHLSADRPDQTESPFTVDPGHIQLESDLVIYSSKQKTDSPTSSWSWFTLNFKIGLTERDDLQFITDPLQQEHRELTSLSSLTLRWKHQLFHDSPIKLSIMPFITLPRHSLQWNHCSVGLILPMSANSTTLSA